LSNLSGDGYDLLLCDGLSQLPGMQWVRPKRRPDLRRMQRQGTLCLHHLQRVEAEAVSGPLARQVKYFGR